MCVRACVRCVSVHACVRCDRQFRGLEDTALRSKQHLCQSETARWFAVMQNKAGERCQKELNVFSRSTALLSKDMTRPV